MGNRNACWICNIFGIFIGIGINFYKEVFYSCFVMKYIHSNLVWILLAIIVMTTGMCSEIERADSFLSFQSQSIEAEMIDNIKNTTSYIGNCTNKLITGLKDTFQRSRRGQGRIGFKNYAEYLWIKKILHLFLSFFVAMSVVCINIQSGNIAILNYIHNQDGEK